MAVKGSATTIWDRTRGYLFFRVDDPSEAAARVSKLFAQGGNDFVVIRADVVLGSDFNLIIPLDAQVDVWDRAVAEVEAAAKSSAKATARVKEYHPAIPHQAHCFVTEDEFRAYPLHEYSPPGRHPQSPGANPWG